MDEIDRIKTRRHAEASAKGLYEQHYEQGQGADQYDPNQYQQPNLNY